MTQMLARWIREARPDARILVATDRKELDEQIEVVVSNTGDKVRRAKSGVDQLAVLADPKDWVVASLVHKFGRREEDELGTMIAEIQHGQIGAPVDEFLVFIDEAHRTQSGSWPAPCGRSSQMRCSTASQAHRRCGRTSGPRWRCSSWTAWPPPAARRERGGDRRRASGERLNGQKQPKTAAERHLSGRSAIARQSG